MENIIIQMIESSIKTILRNGVTKAAANEKKNADIIEVTDYEVRNEKLKGIANE